MLGFNVLRFRVLGFNVLGLRVWGFGLVVHDRNLNHNGYGRVLRE